MRVSKRQSGQKCVSVTKNAKLYLTEALKEATIYVNGDIARLNARDVSARIQEAIGRLVADCLP